jgi:hypothetical protein
MPIDAKSLKQTLLLIMYYCMYLALSALRSDFSGNERSSEYRQSLVTRSQDLSLGLRDCYQVVGD